VQAKGRAFPALASFSLDGKGKGFDNRIGFKTAEFLGLGGEKWNF
jgi:hypothetical protein